MMAHRPVLLSAFLLAPLALATGCGEPASPIAEDAVAFSVFSEQDVEARLGDGEPGDDEVTDEHGVRDDAAAAKRKASPLGPVIDRLALAPATDEDGGEAWQAVVGIANGDPEHHTLEFGWRVNGEEAFVQGDTFSVSALQRGDTLEVEVRASDGFAWSASASSGTIRIGNAPPAIETTPPRLGPDGSFRYVIRASDRDDEDELRFELRTGPTGMTVDAGTGLVSWKPTLEQAGRHDVEVAVVDGQGGEASQSFVLSLVAQDEVPASPKP